LVAICIIKNKKNNELVEGGGDNLVLVKFQHLPVARLTIVDCNLNILHPTLSTILVYMYTYIILIITFNYDLTLTDSEVKSECELNNSLSTSNFYNE